MARCTMCEHECDSEHVITLAGHPLLFDSIACALATSILVCLQCGGKIVEYGVNTRDTRCWCTTHTQTYGADAAMIVVCGLGSTLYFVQSDPFSFVRSAEAVVYGDAARC